MIPAHGWIATYKAEKGIHSVVAWDDDGRALIVHRKRGALVPAATEDGFTGLIEDDDPQQIIPGGGWLAEWRGTDGETWTEPVVAWRVTYAGWGSPLFTDSMGVVAPDESGQVVRVYHPDVVAPKGPTTESAE